MRDIAALVNSQPRRRSNPGGLRTARPATTTCPAARPCTDDKQASRPRPGGQQAARTYQSQPCPGVLRADPTAPVASPGRHRQPRRRCSARLPFFPARAARTSPAAVICPAIILTRHLRQETMVGWRIRAGVEYRKMSTRGAGEKWGIQ